MLSRTQYATLMPLPKFWLNSFPLSPDRRESLKKWTYLHHNLETIRHLFRVTASLDSMVVGESQILGQVKEAYDASREAGGAGTILNRLFTKAFSVGKRIRSETTIATGAVSISYAAVELAKKIFNTLEGKTVAIVGAGE